MKRWGMGSLVKKAKRVLFAGFFFISIFSSFLTGCVTMKDPKSSFDYSGDIVATVDQRSKVGQTFISRRSGFNGIQIWLRDGSKGNSGSGLVKVSLFHSIFDRLPIETKSIPIDQIRRTFPVEISFNAQKDPPAQQYFIELEVEGGTIAIYGRANDDYPDGSLYLNKTQLKSDLAFRTSYEYGAEAVLEDSKSAIKHLWLILPLLVLLLAPGYLILETTDTNNFRIFLKSSPTNSTIKK